VQKKKHEKAQEIGAIEMHNGGVFGEINCAHPLATSPFSIIFDAERFETAALRRSLINSIA